MHRTRFTRLLALSAATVGLACQDNVSANNGSGSPCTGQSADFVVDATDAMLFTPADLTLSPGQTVCWQNTGVAAHTVTSDDGGATFHAELSSGTFLVHTFPMEGAVPYHCIPHSGVPMVGTVTVQE